jgi:hypothetical protein
MLLGPGAGGPAEALGQFGALGVAMALTEIHLVERAMEAASRARAVVTDVANAGAEGEQERVGR